MNKLTPQQIEDEAKRIQKEYAYMDTMPMEGWMWEFIRRGREYRSLYERLLKIEPLNAGPWTAIRRAESKGAYRQLLRTVLFYEPRSLASQSGINPSTVETIQNVNRDHYTILPPVHENDAFDAWINMSYSLFPNPNIPYSAFADDMKPEIANSVWFTILTPEEILDKIAAYPLKIKYRSLLPDYKTFFHTRLQPHLKHSSILRFQTDSNQEAADMELETLRELIGWQVSDLIVIIDRRAKKTDVETHLVPTLKKYLSPKKERKLDKKWKYYLIAYDLYQKKPKHRTYEEIASIMYEAFPEIETPFAKGGTKGRKPIDSINYFTESNCRNHCRSALELINGGYKDYLYSPELS